MNRIACLLLLATACFVGSARAGHTAVPGELIIENPTLICLGFEWRISGDDNHNAIGEVRFRETGKGGDWRVALPLYRIGKGREARGYSWMTYTIPDALCGSILNLEPDTSYDVRLTVQDPDGVTGEAVKTLTLRTRAEPKPLEGGEVRHVYPPDHEGEKEKPTYKSIMHAVNGYHPWCDCYQTIHTDAAKPGTIVKLHAGTYKIDRYNYREHTQRWLHGIITLVPDGEPGKPIAIVAAGDGEVVIDGGGNHNLFNIMAADYLHFEGLTIRNTDIAFHCGFQGVIGCKGLTVKNCWIEDVMFGVLAQDGRSEDFYVADNVIIGRNPHKRFNPIGYGARGRTKAGYAVNLAGKGHVACYNYCADMWDVMNVYTQSLADPAHGQQSRAIDFYNNDLFNATDNFIESDGGYANIRMLRNRCFNCLAEPVSVQFIYAGPVYWIRNIIWNTCRGKEAVKPKPWGDAPVFVFLHNTTSCHFRTPCMDSWDIRNNLFMGPADFLSEHDRNNAVQRNFGRYVAPAAPNRTVDHNAYRTGLKLPEPYVVGNEAFASLEKMAAKAGFEKCGLELTGYDIFAKAAEPNHAGSGNTSALVHPRDYDLRPAAGSPIVDAGAAIRGVNEGYTGNAPDIGAQESGQPATVYGPRSGPYLERLKQLRAGTYTPTVADSKPPSKPFAGADT